MSVNKCTGRGRALALAACAAGLVVGAGCGGDRDGVEASLHSLRQAFVAEDYQAVCARLTPAAQRQVGSIGHSRPTSCPRDMAEKLSATILSRRDRMEPEVRDVRFDGDRATVLAILGGDTPAELQFAKHRGAWKLASVFSISAAPVLRFL